MRGNGKKRPPKYLLYNILSLSDRNQKRPRRLILPSGANLGSDRTAAALAAAKDVSPVGGQTNQASGFEG